MAGRRHWRSCGGALSVLALSCCGDSGDDRTMESPAPTVEVESTDGAVASAATTSAATTPTSEPTAPPTNVPTTLPAATSANASPASTSTTVADERADVTFREGTNPCTADELPVLAALHTASGELQWTACSSEEAYRDIVGLSDAVVLVGISREDGRELIAYDATNGGGLWRRTLPPLVNFGLGWGKGELAGGGIVVVEDAQSAGGLVGLEAMSGAERWRSAGAPPVAHSESVVVTMAPDGQLAGHDRATGLRLWTTPAMGGGDMSGDLSGWWAGAVDGDRLFLAAGSATVALDIASGAEVWRGPQLDDPWAGDGHVVGGVPQGDMPDLDGPEIAAVDASTGVQTWTGPGRESYPDLLAVGDGAIVVTHPDNGELLAYELATGQTRWEQPFRTLVGDPQAVMDGVVFTLWEDVLAAVSTADGSLRWAWRSPVGSPWMNHLDANSSTVFVAVNSLPWGD